MNDSPGWASPGSDPSDGDRPAARPEQPAQPAPQPQQPQQPQKWAAEQPPPGTGAPQEGVWGSPNANATGTGTGPGTAPGPGTPPPAPPHPRTGWNAGTTPGTGWGAPQYPGHAPGGWGKPPAAKPGVIPLRPLGLGEILDGAFSTLRSHWRSVLPISFGVAVVAVLAITLVQGLMLDRMEALDSESADVDDLVSFLSGTLLAGAGALVITFLGTIVATAMLTMIYSRAVLGRPSSVGEAWRECRPQLLRLAGLTALVAIGGGVIVALGFLPAVIAAAAGMGGAGVAVLAVLGGLAGLVVWVWLYIRVSLAPSALMLERSGVFKSLARSDKLVRGAWWRILGISLLASVIAGAVEFIIGIPFSVVALISEGVSNPEGMDGLATSWTYLVIIGIGSVIAMTITLPFKAGVSVLLYIDQRIRREALDLELARAAGVQDYGTTPGGGTPPPAGS
ncbi:hypothetical protein [Streptomyces sp. NPDC012888]|uniref:hypothetical protein n=1 Tax=Streptomyces sp. NPDC012888 TaxID=3364855 RepID=UPI0036952521